jgi:predicted AAA+ superfamily ATPase
MKKNVFYIPRELETAIELYRNSPEIIAIIGTRQCGKTTLMQHIMQGIKGKRVVFLDFEDRDELNLFTSDIKSFAKLHVEGKDFLFIDEFQYAAEGGKQLKYLYDHFPIKIIITGSSATELSIQSIRHLVGRIFVFTLHPFYFYEFLSYKEPNLAELIRTEPALSSVIIERTQPYYQEYLIYGGYPRVVLADSFQEKEVVLKNIFQTYLLKEIRQILNYRHDLKLEKLIRALAFQVSGICNYNELSGLTGLKYRELLEALDILTNTFVVSPARPYFTNKRLELVKSPKYYFIDNGFRNSAVKNFRPPAERSDRGALHENFIAAELLKKDIDLRYWRTKSKAEVDFIIDQGNQLVPLEVKTQLGGPRVSRSFRSFIDKYHPAQAIIASNTFFANDTLGETTLSFRPHWQVIADL